MKSLIICQSAKNTKMIAQKMSSIMGSKIIKPSGFKKEMLERYDLIGFGSGIWAGKMRPGLIKLAKSLPALKAKKAFIFSTYGGEKGDFHSELRGILKEKGFEVIDEFKCLGNFHILFFRTKIAQGRPDADDLAEAEMFAKGLLKK